MATFKSSARSVDMLGRQQIAGIPTAVSEIFKNAYDAYASEVRGDYYARLNVLTIRDNGVGMSLDDFTTRWLTIGTESKAVNSSLPRIARPGHMAERRQMGEKGIGRLAIATIGPQLLVATRGRSASGESLDYVVLALVQWSMFEIPGITLDEVAVPIRQVSDDVTITADLIDEMVSEVLEMLDRIDTRVPKEHSLRIRAELASIHKDIGPLLRHTGPKLTDGTGTAFIVSPVSDDVGAVMTARSDRKNEFAVSEFQRFLLGFTNSITPSSSVPDFQTRFFQHGPEGAADLIDRSTYFWESGDFEHTDHTVEGEFDALGTFRGVIRIYDQEPLEVVQPWVGGRGRSTAVGSFGIKFGYVQGKASESRLEAGDFASMTARLESIGGLYVYRDGIRVLPYGNSDYDYLEVEKRRSLNAATYYFSYRRMFGAVNVSSFTNGALQEKAGREGFRENAAYRDFKEILKDFLIQLAATYFSARNDPSEEWRSRRQELSAESQKRREEDRERNAFAKRLSDAIQYIEGGAMAQDFRRLTLRTRAMVREAEIGAIVLDPDGAEREFLRSLRVVEDKFTLSRPPKLPLTVEIERDWHAYQAILPVARDLVLSSSSTLEELASAFEESDAGVQMDRDLRQRRIEKSARQAQDSHRESVQEVEDRISSTMTVLTQRLAENADNLEHEIAICVQAANTGSFSDEILASRRVAELIQTADEDLRQIMARVEEMGRSDTEDVVRLQERILDLEDQIDNNLELLQLGQAVQVVSHEFEASIGAVRRGLKLLDPWARSTPRLVPVVSGLRSSFGHLDGYLRLFTPLQRRLQNSQSTINGGEIENFLRGVFSERLDREGTVLVVTEAFRDFHFIGYPSTFLPVFVNLVDNSLHWIAEGVPPREIRLSVDADALLVSDSGPGVRPRDAQYIFERGFSRRRGGRGLGLALAAELLERDGWKLSLDSSSAGASFRIEQNKGGGEE